MGSRQRIGGVAQRVHGRQRVPLVRIQGSAMQHPAGCVSRLALVLVAFSQVGALPSRPQLLSAAARTSMLTGSTATPTDAPTHAPSLTPTNSPSASPSHTPTLAPTGTPTVPGTHAPSEVPSAPPTRVPTPTPTVAPSAKPSEEPTAS